jgi:hypothetical protein
MRWLQNSHVKLPVHIKYTLINLYWCLLLLLLLVCDFPLRMRMVLFVKCPTLPPYLHALCINPHSLSLLNWSRKVGKILRHHPTPLLLDGMPPKYICTLLQKWSAKRFTVTRSK